VNRRKSIDAPGNTFTEQRTDSILKSAPATVSTVPLKKSNDRITEINSRDSLRIERFFRFLLSAE